MRPFRSLLFVPGHKETWIDKAIASGTHAVILDLEDAVPTDQKHDAREVTGRAVESLASDPVGVVVRVNPLDTIHFGKDLAAVVRPGLTALLLPKIYTAHDLAAFDALVRHFEIEAGMPVGTVGLIPSLETARALTNVEAIASGPRVVSLMAAAAKDADISREIGFRWTPTGLETLYLRSRVILAARSAGVRHVVLGLWQDLHDLEGLRTFATDNAALGFGGQVLIHPSHVGVVNEVYGVDEQELTRLQDMIDTYEQAVASGEGAVMYGGEHIDLAHVENARQILAMERQQREDA